MDAKQAIVDTCVVAKHHPKAHAWMAEGDTGPLSMGHVYAMEQAVFDADLAGKPFSPGKLNRWLGWMQAVCCMWEVLTLDECKEINRSHA